MNGIISCINYWIREKIFGKKELENKIMIEDLVDDILIHMTQFCKSEDLLAFGSVNRRFNNLIDNENLWKERLKMDFDNILRNKETWKLTYIDRYKFFKKNYRSYSEKYRRYKTKYQELHKLCITN